MDAVDHDLSDAQWAALQAAWSGCAYCGATDQAMQRDCVLPLSRGGRYTLDNIVPACRSCNASKSNHEVTGWMRRKKLSEREFLVRHLEIGRALVIQFAPEPPATDVADLVIGIDDLTHPDVLALLEHHLADLAQHSPAESTHALDLTALRAPDITFWTAWSRDDLVGCGALGHLDAGHGEIKSMRVADAFVGRGAGAAILQRLIDEAVLRGYSRLSLETGSPAAFLPARTLYSRHGFVPCGPFSTYTEDPWNIFMTLALPPA